MKVQLLTKIEKGFCWNMRICIKIKLKVCYNFELYFLILIKRLKFPLTNHLQVQIDHVKEKT